MLLWLAGNANAQCVPETLASRVAVMLHLTPNRSASPTEGSCRSESVAHPLAPPRPSNLSVVVARGLRAEIERGAAPQTSIAGSAESPIAARLALQWRNLRGPGWSDRVPDWVVKDAVNYRRRGLPLVHLWQSTNYQLALGVSNHRVPGIYFMQKVP